MSTFSDAKTIRLEDYTPYIGQQVTKKSKKPFKSGLKIATVKGITTNPHTGKAAFTFIEDESVVDIQQIKDDRIKEVITKLLDQPAVWHEDAIVQAVQDENIPNASDRDIRYAIDELEQAGKIVKDDDSKVYFNTI